MKVVIAGGTGFIGKHLVYRLLDLNHEVTVLTREAHAFKANPAANLKVEWWDAKTLSDWSARINGADAVINLAGEGIADKRWTDNQKRALVDSRVFATRALVSAIAMAENKPQVLINASAVGYYGAVPENEVAEDAPRGRGFLADVCAQWEFEAAKAAESGLRVALLRIGVVLEKDGGALRKFIPPFQFFMGGPLGSGRQWFPWIHREDVIGAILFSLENSLVSGPINVTAPGILTMKDFCSVLGKVMHRPSWAPVPAFALKILLGEMSEMIVTGQKAIPRRLEELGYSFRFADALSALSDILKK